MNIIGDNIDECLDSKMDGNEESIILSEQKSELQGMGYWLLYYYVIVFLLLFLYYL